MRASAIVLAITATACDSRLHIAVHPFEHVESAVPNDTPVCSPVPPLPEQNKAFTDYVARALAWRMYCSVDPECDAMQAFVPVDLYGKPMKLTCPRTRLCSAGEDVRYDTPDDACQNVILQGKHFQPLAVPPRVTRYISLEVPLCDGADEPLATIASVLRGRPEHVTITSLDCPTETRCDFGTLRGDNYGLGAVEFVERQWKVTAYDLPNGPRDDLFAHCPRVVR